MLGPTGRFHKECKQRELRKVCLQNFWCADERAYAINLSPGGMCFRMARRAEPGEVVTMSHGPELRVRARIAWARRLDTCTEVGVAFLDSQERVDSWMAFLGTESDVCQTDKNGEPILALPAPGQTYRPTFTGARIQITGTSNPSLCLGKSRSWTAAQNLVSSNPSNGNSTRQSR